MKFFITMLVPLIGCLPVVAQPAVKNAKTDSAKEKYILQYDPGVLRVKGNSLPVGIIAISDKGQQSETKGFLNGTDNWSKYKIDVDSGSFSGGKIKIKGSEKRIKKETR